MCSGNSENLEKILVQHAPTRVSTKTSQNFFSSLQEVCAVNCLQKNGRNLSRLYIYNTLKYWETIKTIELNLQLHNYSNKFVFSFNTDLTEYDKQDYTRLASAASKIICCKTNKHLHTKNCFNLLTCTFLSFSILFR